MRKLIIGSFIAIALVFSFACGNTFAQPASKATAKAGEIVPVIVGPKGSAVWTQILSQDIKMPSGKDLFIDVSLECGLTTNTKVMSKQLVRSLAMAEAIVEVQVRINGTPVLVNGIFDETFELNSSIIFARRQQTLIAEFAGMYDFWDEDCVELSYGCRVCVAPDDCTVTPIDGPEAECAGDVVVTGISFSDDPDCYVAESLQLILDTMQANSFNFIAPDVGVGLKTVSVWARLSYDTDTELTNFPPPYTIADYADLLNTAAATAYLGNGSVTIETVRMIKDEDVIDLE